MLAVINSENAIQQKFPFQQSFINYILKTSNSKVFKKFYQSCKYFYQQKPYHIFDDLTFDDYAAVYGHESITFNQNKVIIIGKETDMYSKDIFKAYPLINVIVIPSMKFIPPKNLWITGRILCYAPAKRLPLWISKFTRCTIKDLSALCNLTLKEFKFLTKEETIEEIKIKGVVNSAGFFLAVEDIVAAVPNAIKFSLGYSHVTPLTLKNLCSMNQKKKFKEFRLEKIDNFLNENEYFEFIKTHAAPRVTFLLSFASPITEEFERKFLINVNTKIFLWNTDTAKPYLRKTFDFFRQ